MLPPQSAKEKFITASEDSFDYSVLLLPAALAGHSMATKATRSSIRAPPAMAATFGTAMPTNRSRTTRLNSSCRHLRMKTSGIRRWTKAVSLSEPAMRSAASSPGPMLELQPSTVAKSSALAQPLAYLISTIPQANVPSATQSRNGALMSVWMCDLCVQRVLAGYQPCSLSYQRLKQCLIKPTGGF